jgi:hypothetical protein
VWRLLGGITVIYVTTVEADLDLPPRLLDAGPPSPDPRDLVNFEAVEGVILK